MGNRVENSDYQAADLPTHMSTAKNRRHKTQTNEMSQCGSAAAPRRAMGVKDRRENRAGSLCAPRIRAKTFSVCESNRAQGFVKSPAKKRRAPDSIARASKELQQQRLRRKRRCIQMLFFYRIVARKRCGQARLSQGRAAREIGRRVAKNARVGATMSVPRSIISSHHRLREPMVTSFGFPRFSMFSRVLPHYPRQGSNL